ncbi:MAG: hypothetical protein H7840_16875 [Alphaproteobacteria bacterium]
MTTNIERRVGKIEDLVGARRRALTSEERARCWAALAKRAAGQPLDDLDQYHLGLATALPRSPEYEAMTAEQRLERFKSLIARRGHATR